MIGFHACMRVCVVIYQCMAQHAHHVKLCPFDTLESKQQIILRMKQSLLLKCSLYNFTLFASSVSLLVGPLTALAPAPICLKRLDQMMTLLFLYDVV